MFAEANGMGWGPFWLHAYTTFTELPADNAFKKINLEVNGPTIGCSLVLLLLLFC